MEQPLVIAVTALTSMDAKALTEVGYRKAPSELVTDLSVLAEDAGLGGVVSSAQEAESIRARCGPDFKIICPGIRPAGAETGDQARVATPASAIASGANYIVVGRPIRDAEDPSAAARSILRQAMDGQGEAG